MELFVTLTSGAKKSFPVNQFRAFPLLPTMCISPTMKRELKRRKDDFDIVHTHGYWTMTSVYPHYLKQANGGKRPIVISAPRGQFSKWALARSKWKKKLMWLAFQKHALQQVDCFHATGQKELQEIRDHGYRQPIALIPNGIDVVKEECSANNFARLLAECDAIPQSLGSHDRRVLLFLGRIHPVKGLDELLLSWNELSTQFRDWDLVICGPGEKQDVEKIKSLALETRAQRVHFVQGLYGRNKHALYQRADLYVLPSHTENYGMTVAESLAAATPVVTTTGTPWTRLGQQGCGWTIKLGRSELTSTLNQAMSCSRQRLEEMGELGRQWMLDEFGWHALAAQMAAVYDWLLAEQPQHERPEYVDVV